VADGAGVQFGSQGGDFVNTDLVAHRAGEAWGKVELFFGQFNIYDILGFTFVMFFGLLILYLSYVLRKKIVLMILMILIGLSTLIGGPFLMDKLVDSVAKKTTISNLTLKQLQFTDALVVTGKIQNAGKVDFKSCKIVVTTRKTSKNQYKDILLQYKKPANKHIMKLDYTLAKGEEKEFKYIVDGFRTDATMKTEVKGICD
jgi:hypothetical protein